ncbi:MAG: potassium channel family protein [Halofilum sp. (in: g-proteobacteria)]
MESIAWSIGITSVGALLVLVTLRDIWVTLFRPTSQGALSHIVIHAVWRAFRATAGEHADWLKHAGPAAMPAVMLSWALLLTFGWTLIFWARMPGGFALEPELAAATDSAFADAFYLSMVTLSTLGYGDVTPTEGYLRLLAPVESALGFILLTASISWVLSIYPPLTRQRALAHQVSVLQEAEARTGLHTFSRAPETAERALATFCAQIAVVRSDLMQFPVTYFFYDPDGRSALPLALPHLLDLAESAQQSETEGLRLQGTELQLLLCDLAETLCIRLLDLPTTDAREILTAYAHDHMRAL